MARPEHATLYDFRDLDILHRLRENTDPGDGLVSDDIAQLLGFSAEEGGRPVANRLSWMRRYGMVVYDDRARTWSLSQGGERVTRAHLLAPELRIVDSMPDEKMIEVMAHVTSRFQRGEAMLGHMLRREFLYGTKRK